MSAGQHRNGNGRLLDDERVRSGTLVAVRESLYRPAHARAVIDVRADAVQTIRSLRRVRAADGHVRPLTVHATAWLLAATVLAGQTSAPPAKHLTISGTRFLDSSGKAFDWRGITAFRLVEFVAHGRAAEADAYLRWAASKGITVVRVFAMADGIFQLTPADGQHALPQLLELAAKHGLH